MTILKEYRINNHLKQYEMAEKLKCSLQSYRLYENGNKKIPGPILLTFLRISGTDADLILAKKLEEVYEKEV